MQAIIKQTGGVAEPLLGRYRTKLVDGNHLRRTDRRIGELRELNVAPLPGKALVVYDPQYRLAIDVLPCEDGYAQERSLLSELLETIEAHDLWIADRNFCTVGFLFGIAKRQGKFIIRQHGGMPFTLKGRRKRVGETETGVVYEQSMEVSDEHGNLRIFRRITVLLNKPTRDGDREIHITSEAGNNLRRNPLTCPWFAHVGFEHQGRPIVPHFHRQSGVGFVVADERCVSQQPSRRVVLTCVLARNN